MSFNALKKKRGSIQELASKLESQGKQKFAEDDRFYYPERDQDGNAYAVIRFLPPAGEESSAYIQTFRHGYKGPNGWYIEECPTTIGEDCPVCKANGVLYDTLGKEKASQTVSGPNGRKRKMQYVANIYLVSDPKNPEKEGKVYLFKFGAKIFDKIKDAVKPRFPDEIPIDPFDLWEGANFTLKIKKVDGQVNYDASKFSSETGPLGTDKEMEKIYNSEYSLEDLIAPDKFKSYTDLEARFNRVSGEVTAQPSAPAPEGRSYEAPSESTSDLPETSVDTEEDKETLDFFKDMLKGGEEKSLVDEG